MTARSETDPAHRVLLVEDAVGEALLVSSFLRSAGRYDVTHVQDGDRALTLLDGMQFDLLVTDLNLPATDGFDVIRHARKRQPDLPVIAITGFTNGIYRAEAFRVGADEVLEKPLDRDALASAVSRLLGDEPDAATRTTTE